MKPLQNKAYIFVLLSSFIYAFYLVVNRIFLAQDINPLHFACGSGIFSSLFSFIYLLSSKKIKEVKKIDKRSLYYILFLAFLVVFLYKIILFYGQSMVPVASTGFLLRIAPLSALFFGFVLMREKITKKYILIMLVMLFGVFLLATKGEFIFETGSLLILLGGVIIGFEHAFARTIMKGGIDPLVLTSLDTIIGSVFLLTFASLYSPLPLLPNWEVYALSGLLVFLSVYSRNIGLKSIKSGIVSSILLTSPLLTLLLGVALLKEEFTLIQLIGGFIILGGAYFLIKNEVLNKYTEK